jgi:hypothetical protein
MDQDSFLREDNGEVGRSSFRGSERGKREREREIGASQSILMK